MPVRPYEVVYIIDPDVTETDSAALVERFRALAEAQGATDIRVDTHTLGKRRLAYIINHKREGHYIVMHFEGEATVPAELERVLNITDGILRALVVRLEVMPPMPEPPPAPVAPAAVEAPAPAETPAEEAEPVVESSPAEEVPAEVAEPTSEEAPAVETEPEAVAAPAEAAPAEEAE
ncbi:MAG TPA: 30S ribosomal protein S6 [Armatimonadota bacterium]|jgi:small subunit ribosomal protein S6